MVPKPYIPSIPKPNRITDRTRKIAEQMKRDGCETRDIARRLGLKNSTVTKIVGHVTPD